MANQACGPFRKRMGSRRNFHSWWEWTEWLHVLAFVKTEELKKQQQITQVSEGLTEHLCLDGYFLMKL